MKPVNKEILNFLKYDPVQGTFVWAVSPNNKFKVGRPAGYITTSKTNSKRLIIHFRGKRYSASKLAFLVMEDHYPEGHVRFKDSNPLNYKWSNLTLDADHELENSPKINWKTTKDITIPPIPLAYKLNKF